VERADGVSDGGPISTTRMRVVCAVGSTDPWNAAGLGLDLLALAECGVRAVMVVAGVTAQDEAGVRALLPVPAEIVRAQFAALGSLTIDGYRVGALLDAASAAVVAEQLAVAVGPVVYDPVFAPSGGGSFAGPELIETIAGRLLERVDVLTPNLAEAGELLQRTAPRTVAEMADAARRLVARGPRAVLVKGGHLEGDRAVDVYFDGELRIFDDARIDTVLRGTGCLLADAIAAGLARGCATSAAVAQARAFVRGKIERGAPLGPMRTAY
jgi:hydroxymethylpyrimidine/phosphomethylpyrimidine kinase